MRGSRQETVLITGASSGLGLVLARLLLRRTNHRLVLTARGSSLGRFGEAGIEQTRRVRLLPLNVRDDGERRAVVAEAEQTFGGVSVLVNNAGVAYRSVVEHVSEEERLRQMDINFRSPMELARLVLPRMRERQYGRIITVSSASGMMAMPTMAVYSASKFAVEGATEALWYEVRPWGIHVTLVQPGFINAASFKNTRFTDRSRHAVEDESDPYHRHYAAMGPFIARMMKLSWATHEQVARRILRVMRDPRPPLRVPATPDAKLFYLLRRLLPRRLYHAVLYRNLPEIRRWGPGTGRPRDE